MKIHDKELDDVAVSQARLRFERNANRAKRSGHKRKIRFSFNELLDHFANDRISFRRIGELACEEGVSREGIRQLYCEYFQGLFPEKRPKQKPRKLDIPKKRHLVRETCELDFSDDKIFSTIAEQASKAGCVVHRTVNQRDGRFMPGRRMLLIGGSPYWVYRTRSTFSQGNVESLIIDISLSSLRSTTGIIIFLRRENKEDRIFIIPSKDILEAYGDGAYGKRKNKNFSVYIPIETGPNYRKHSPRLDWLSYENAWPCKESDLGA